MESLSVGTAELSSVASASLAVGRTWQRASLKWQPQPRAAATVSFRAGKCSTPSAAWSSTSRAIITPHSGTPWMKLLVPSIGSMIQRKRGRSRRGVAWPLAELLADDGVIGEGLSDLLANQPLGRPVSIGHRRGIALVIDAEGRGLGGMEIWKRDRPGLPGQIGGEFEQAVELRSSIHALILGWMRLICKSRRIQSNVVI